MAVNLPPMGTLAPIEGIEIGTAAAGIKHPDRDDVAVFAFAVGTVVGGVFTQSSYRAAPVELAAERLGPARGFVVNSGNANAATGERGIIDAATSAKHVAEAIACDPGLVLPFSTGVIGEFLPMASMQSGIESACADLRPDGWAAAAGAIMTTDTAPKGVSERFSVGGRDVVGTGIVKGSGMMRPDMATMLAFLGTDAKVSAEVATQLARDLAQTSFNRLTIDGDTSTNDSFVIAATGAVGGDAIDDPRSGEYAQLLAGLSPIVRELAIRTVRDGEGATKFVTVRVSSGRNQQECLQVAYTVAHSPLVKTAMFAGDPNWGRFCMAIGRAGIDDLDPYAVDLFLDDVCVAENGLVAPSYQEADAARVMQRDEYEVRIDLGRGSHVESVWTSDLSYEYVRINAEYRT